MRAKKRGWKGRERTASEERRRKGGWILLVHTGSHGGPERPLQASTMSDHISVAASSFPALRTHGKIHSRAHARKHQHKNTNASYINFCAQTQTTLEKCHREVLSLNLNLSPPLSCIPCGPISQQSLREHTDRHTHARTHARTHAHTHTYTHTPSLVLNMVMRR